MAMHGMLRRRRSRMNDTDVNTNRLFCLFAQKRGHHYENGALRVDWNVFCSDLHDPAHESTWQRLSQQIIKHHRSRSPLQSYVPTSEHLFDGKFKRSFNVAMALTLRALTIKGVTSAIIAKTQTSLCQHQLKHCKPDVKDHQIDLSLPGSVPSCRHFRDQVVPIRSNSFPDLRQKAGDHQPAKTMAAPTFLLSSKLCRRESIALVRTKSLPTRGFA
jgi:hypothetical protein|mmetsp:Transcript_12810/g.18572  ORF Transcript_12810/g.18572 Transcript_12810/m.18572 type:complete len:216 (+) Transcript_12810:66-713(+)|eukprot:CAMPEP_0173083112 /NCGR_PEP_ID=MMETSP1102-20130122/19091_1 /TAXON_ID=49646 /ORGANISM="Geminigera sp., Strain Caron Lab Isolate" /LENGTH=215 /DNA_ID=CAMNT_0013959655 /DNA_START=65 /DNA_END=712 /DNA_ORIENTATION=-